VLEEGGLVFNCKQQRRRSAASKSSHASIACCFSRPTWIELPSLELTHSPVTHHLLSLINVSRDVK